MIATLGLSLGACAQTQTETANQVNQTARTVERLDSLFDYLVQNEMYNGGVGVRQQGEIIFLKGYGPGNFETGTSFSTSSQTEIASVSKQFTAAAIMLLQEDGLLKVEDSINRYFEPALPLDGITIHHLLTHTSGVPDYEKYFGENWKTKDLVDNKIIVGYLHREKPEPMFAPGEKYTYSNLGYVLLAEIVEKVSGRRLDVFLNQRIFEPGGMSQTGFFPRSDIFDMPNYAPGMLWSEEQNQYVRPETVEGKEFVWYLSARFGPGRLTSTVEDLLKWDSLLHTQTILRDESKEQMFKGYVDVPSKLFESQYGYGFRILQDGSLGREIEHGGSWPGNFTHIKRYLDDETAYVLLNNTSSPYMADIRKALDAILKGETFEYPKLKEKK